MFKRLKEILRRLIASHTAWPIVLSVGLLLTASVLAVHAATSDTSSIPGQQERNILIGVAVMVLALIPNYEWFGRLAWPALGVILLLLALVLHTDAVNGSRRWFNVTASMAVQPSELAKIAFICALGWYLRYRKDIRQVPGLVIPFVLAAIPCGLIMIEPDMGTALLFPLTLYVMLIAAGARLRHLVVIAVVLTVAIPGCYPFLKPYQQDRVKSFIAQFYYRNDPVFLQAHQKNAGYQQHIGVVALASGGATGHGVQGADLVKRGILPEAQTDFIFDVVGSQWGFAGTATAIFLYLAFLAAAFEIAASTKDPFGRLIVVGLASVILFQAWINIAMTVGIGPVVGITLPFISYGGSSLVANMLAAGIMLNVSVRRHGKNTRFLTNSEPRD